MELRDCVCVVTGSARGIGKGIGLRLARDGASVVFADMDQAGAAKAAQEAQAAGGKAIAVAVDITSRQQVRDMVVRTVAEFGELNVMVNNAGISQLKPFIEMTEAEYERVLRVNSTGTFLCMQEAARQMIEQGRGGKIINAGSIASREGYPNLAHYCASKHAVLALTHAAAREWAQHKITVNAYAPGVVATELWGQLDQESIELGNTKEPGEALEGFGAGILLGRLGTPEDIAAVVAFLVGPDSDYVTGQLLVCDGGMLLW